MKQKIGFWNEIQGDADNITCSKDEAPVSAPKKSLVQVYFPKRGMDLSYYNDQFDLQVGDIVYVDGKLEGLRGRVTAVNYSFKIKLSDYKRVVAVADTHISGELRMAGSHLVSFAPRRSPMRKSSPGSRPRTKRMTSMCPAVMTTAFGWTTSTE